jgi:hypothetical protein
LAKRHNKIFKCQLNSMVHYSIIWFSKHSKMTPANIRKTFTGLAWVAYCESPILSPSRKSCVAQHSAMSLAWSVTGIPLDCCTPRKRPKHVRCKLDGDVAWINWVKAMKYYHNWLTIIVLNPNWLYNIFI